MLTVASCAGALRQRLLSRMQHACGLQAPLLSSGDVLPAVVPAVLLRWADALPVKGCAHAVLLRVAEGACQPAVHHVAFWPEKVCVPAWSWCTMIWRSSAHHGMHCGLLESASCCR